MKLHTVFITHNRLELTKRTIESYLETVTAPFTACVVDNGSTDGTQDWLFHFGMAAGAWEDDDSRLRVMLWDDNRYPGAATNAGWVWAEDATHLHRSDNDMEYLPGWCDQVKRRFVDPKVGQVGLRTDAEDEYAANTGGNCVIRRELFDAGLRYDERPWPQIREEVGDGYSEDSFFSARVKQMGYTWTRVKRPCIRNLASGDWKDPYYVESYGVRGIRPRRDDPTLPDDWSGGYST